MRAKEDAKKIEKLKTELNDLKSELKRLKDEKRTMNILGKTASPTKKVQAEEKVEGEATKSGSGFRSHAEVLQVRWKR